MRLHKVVPTHQGLSNRAHSAKIAIMHPKNYIILLQALSSDDVFANRAVTIPEPVRAGLVDAADTLVQTASNAMSAAACLDRGAQDRPTGSGQEPTGVRSRQHEGPTPMAQDVPRVARP
jgi:hypothetical protein